VCMRKLTLPLVLFLTSVASSWGQGTPNCSATYHFTTTGRTTTYVNNKPTTSGGGQGCVAWRVVYWTTTTSAVSIEIDGAPDVNGTPGSWTALTPASGGGSGSGSTTNPATSNNVGQILACCDYYPWISMYVNTLTSSGAGTQLTVLVLGYKGTSAASTGGGGEIGRAHV
jgi:hypothetical protein